MDSALQSTELYKTAFRTVADCHMLEHGDRVAVGVSGGADSVALLAFLCALRGEMALELTVCHVNHCLRGEESDGDEAFVRELSERFGLVFRLCSFEASQGAAQSGLGVEEYSRERRYDFFEQCSGGNGKVATAHTLSDSLETVIFNMTRGAGVKGLCGIPKQRGRIVRPLRDCTREQVESFLAAIGQPYRNDSTNETDIYSRNYIRHNIIPAMSRLNPSLHLSMSRMMEQMEQQWRMTEELAELARGQITLDELTFDRRGFLALPQPVSALLLQQWLDSAGAGSSARLLELMYRFAQKGGGGVELASGVRFAAEPDRILIIRERQAVEPFCRELILPRFPQGTAQCPLCKGKTLSVTRILKKKNENTEKFYNKDLKNLADCDRIKELVFVHEPREQDRILLQDRVHRLLTRYRVGTKGLSNGDISRMGVVEDADGVVWAERLGTSQRCACDDATEFYLFEVLEDAVE